MRYCLFESGDVVGPFTASELLARAGFGSQSLVCPENHSEEESYWKQAAFYTDFDFSVRTNSSKRKSLTKKNPASKKTDSRIQETAAETKKNASAPQVNTSAVPTKKEEKEPSKAIINPVIPARAQEAAEAQAAETPTIPPLPIQGNAPEKDSIPLAQADVQEKSISQTNPIEEYFNTMQSGDLGNILGIPDPKTNSDLEFERVIEKQMEKTDPHAPKVGASAGDTFDELVPSEPVTVQEKVVKASNPADLDKQTQAQLKQDLEQAKSTRVDDTDSVGKNLIKGKKDSLSSAARAVGGELYWLAMAGLIALVLGGWLFISYQHAVRLDPQTPAAPVVAQTITAVEQELPASPAVAALPVEEVKTPEEQAKEIVQTYTLDQNRGTVADYLAKRYAKELAQGYTAAWAAEPLHRDVYVVKYRLAKSRKEPIMYVFQADTSKKKLTGALNNITLDLVGKINS